MLLENKLIAELRLIFKMMEGIKEDLTALENKSIFENKTSKFRLFIHLKFLLNHFNYYSKTELKLFSDNELSKSCVELLNHISSQYSSELDRMFYLKNIPEKFVEQLRELIQKIEQSEKEIISVEKTVQFELQQKRKARGLARSKVDLKNIGCYHYTFSNRILHIMRNGIISVEYARTELQHELEISMENIQGSNYLSVYDPYSYWRLYRYFLVRKTLGRIMQGHLTEEDLRGAFKANKDLNFSRFAEVNINLYKHVFNDPQNMFITPFKNTMIEIARGGLELYPSVNFPQVGDIVLIINDTASFLPDHDNAYPYEARFKDKIDQTKIVGIILTDKSEKYSWLMKEFVKFIGIPLYDQNGNLVWPTK